MLFIHTLQVHVQVDTGRCRPDFWRVQVSEAAISGIYFNTMTAWNDQLSLSTMKYHQSDGLYHPTCFQYTKLMTMRTA